jgi:MFS transporter, SP family, arabinose:H+ symporter
MQTWYNNPSILKRTVAIEEHTFAGTRLDALSENSVPMPVIAPADTQQHPNAPHERVRVTAVLVMSALVAALGGLLFGADTAVIAGTTHALTQVFQLTPVTLGITVSSALWGTIVGALFAGYAGERFGRRDSLRVMAILYLLSAIGCAVSWSWGALLAARILGGLGIGGSSVLGPMYIAEIAPARLRGRLVGLFQFNIVVGILLAYLSNYLVSLHHLGALEWRWQLGMPAIPSAAFLVLLFLIPRSPRWLVKKGRMREAESVLERVGEAYPEERVEAIAQSIREEESVSGERLFSRSHRLPIFLAISIAAFSQLSGINAVLYYLNDIFAAAGASTASSGMQTVIVGATNLVFTTLAMLTIDRFGRRVLLLIGSVGMATTLAGIAAIFYTHTHRNLLVWLLVAYCASFSFSLGAVIWVYISEVFPNGVRAKGQSLGSISHWVINALVSAAFPAIAARSGGSPFAFFAVVMVVQFFVVWFVYPETKNISLEQMHLGG